MLVHHRTKQCSLAHGKRVGGRVPTRDWRGAAISLLSKKRAFPTLPTPAKLAVDRAPAEFMWTHANVGGHMLTVVRHPTYRPFVLLCFITRPAMLKSVVESPTT